MYVNDQKTKALLIAVASVPPRSSSRSCGFGPATIYHVEDITFGRTSWRHVYRGRYAGHDLLTGGLPLNLAAHSVSCLAHWIQVADLEQARILYAERG